MRRPSGRKRGSFGRRASPRSNRAGIYMHTHARTCSGAKRSIHATQAHVHLLWDGKRGWHATLGWWWGNAAPIQLPVPAHARGELQLGAALHVRASTERQRTMDNHLVLSCVLGLRLMVLKNTEKGGARERDWRG